MTFNLVGVFTSEFQVAPGGLKRGLSLGRNNPSQELESYFKKFIDAKQFSKHVLNGILLLKQKKIRMEKSL